MSTGQGITFPAEFSKAATTIDGGWIVSFTVNQREAKQVMELAALRDLPLQIGVVPAGLNIGQLQEFEVQTLESGLPLEAEHA